MEAIFVRRTRKICKNADKIVLLTMVLSLALALSLTIGASVGYFGTWFLDFMLINFFGWD